ncbi:hypothetical protein TNCV_694641 [Trichonephila clavipes]|nr:hypothetical protein TNCV_694641 [Trichonephila clavipes]
MKEVETDPAIEEASEIMHINQGSESKYEKSDRHETFELNMLPKEIYEAINVALRLIKSHGVISGERGGHAIQALSRGSLLPIHLLSTGIFNQSRTEKDASVAVHHLAAKLSYLVHFLPIEEIAIVVEQGWALSQSRSTSGPPRHFEVTA